MSIPAMNGMNPTPNFSPSARAASGADKGGISDQFTADSESAGCGVYGRMSFAKQGERSGGDVDPIGIPLGIAADACCG